MPRDKLHQSLDELHQQLEAAGRLDAAARQHLQSVMQDIREVLERSTDSGPDLAGATTEEHRSGMIDRLRDWKEQFEGEHPTLTKTVVELIETLRRIV
jgi:hypothetical protein